MKGLPLVPDNILEDSVSLSFQSPAFKLHRFKFLIKDLTLLKKCLLIPGIAHTKILTMSVLPSLQSVGLEFLLPFLLSLRLDDSIKWTLFNHSRKQIEVSASVILYGGTKLSFTANAKSTPVYNFSAVLHQNYVLGHSCRISIFRQLFPVLLKYKHLPQYFLQ